MSCPTGLAIHRGTEHRGRCRGKSWWSVSAAVIPPGSGHEIMMRRRYHADLPAEVRRNLKVSLVDELPRIEQRHDIDRLDDGLTDPPWRPATIVASPAAASRPATMPA